MSSRKHTRAKIQALFEAGVAIRQIAKDFKFREILLDCGVDAQMDRLKIKGAVEDLESLVPPQKIRLCYK